MFLSILHQATHVLAFCQQFQLSVLFQTSKFRKDCLMSLRLAQSGANRTSLIVRLASDCSMI